MKKLFLMCLFSLGGYVANAQKPSAVVTQKVHTDSITVFVLKNAHLYLDEENVKKGDELVINGPLFDDRGQPVGGFVTRTSTDDISPGKDAPQIIKSTVPPKSGGGNFESNNYIFGQDVSGDYFMMPYDEAIDMRELNADFAIQNGMAMVVNGNNICNKESKNKKTRIGIGFNANNELVVVDSQKELTFYEMGEIFKKYKAINALYLDGFANGYIDDLKQTGKLPEGAVKIHIN